jgi:hypothetical protein
MKNLCNFLLSKYLAAFSSHNFAENEPNGTESMNQDYYVTFLNKS